MSNCEETCIGCGDDIGIHHLCTDCLEELDGAHGTVQQS
jgi:hypothetical protein